MGIYLFEKGYVKTDFGLGAAISILMLVIVAAMSVVYVRRMLRVGEVDVSRRFSRRLGWNALGLAVFAVMVFPVFWMVSTCLQDQRPDQQLQPDLVPAASDARALPGTRFTGRTSGPT